MRCENSAGIILTTGIICDFNLKSGGKRMHTENAWGIAGGAGVVVLPHALCPMPQAPQEPPSRGQPPYVEIANYARREYMRSKAKKKSDVR